MTTRVLLADDSPLFREAIGELLSGRPSLALVGVAENGAEAVAMTEALRPDLVIMDVMMPVMDGLTAVETIMARCPTPIMVMTSDPDGRSGVLSMEALARGALELIVKPEALSGNADALVSRMEFLAQVPVVRHVRGHRHRWQSKLDTEPPPSSRRAAVPRRSGIDIVAVVASTGGPATIAELLSLLPAELPATVVVVQHMHKGFAKPLCAWLATASALPVELATPGDTLDYGTVFIAPPAHNVLVNRRLHMVVHPSTSGVHTAGDELLASLAEHAPQHTCGVVLTGMGSDGATGLRKLRDVGGATMAQDAASCTVNGMPAAAVAAGGAEVTGPVDELARRITELVGRS